MPPADGWPLIFIDLTTGTVKRRPLADSKDPECPACGGTYEFLDAEEVDTVHMCGADAYQVLGKGGDIDFDVIQEKVAGVTRISQRAFLLQMDINDGIKISLFRDGRAIIRGVDNPGRAKAVYDKFIGS